MSTTTIHEFGHVLRYHTLPNGHQTVAEHTFNMLVLAHNYFPNERKEFFLSILFHDAAESLVGDIPHPTKNLVPEIGGIEEKVLKSLGLFWELDEREKEILSFLDMYECYLHANQQLGKGWENVRRNAREVLKSRHSQYRHIWDT